MLGGSQASGVLLKPRGNRSGIERVGRYPVAGPILGDPNGQQDAGCLRLPISEQRILWNEAEVRIVSEHGREQVAGRGDGNDTGTICLG